MPERTRTGGSGLLGQLPTDRLAEHGRELLGLLAEQAIDRAVDSVEDLAERLIDYSQHGGPGLIAAITGGKEITEAKPPLRTTVKAGVTGVSASVKHAFAGMSGPHRSTRAIKAMNIVEQIDVGVPVRLAYDQWTRFQDFSQFMKKVRAVEKTSDETSSWKVQAFWSHRGWDATIVEQIPDQRIVWRSEGVKGHVDGSVSFHVMTPDMTRILVVLEYYPKGLLERAGNLWRTQRRRARMELEQFRCHVMTRVVLDPDSVQGWRGEIRNSTVVRTHEDAMAAEARESGEGRETGAAADAPTASGLDVEQGTDVVEQDTGHGGDTYADEEDDYADEDEIYDDADQPYEDEPEREPARSGGGNQ
ncbi:MAG TPA: SRPBCC family protein [Pseudonocardiaceae bacterium]